MADFADPKSQVAPKAPAEASTPWYSKPVARDAAIGAALGTAFLPVFGTAAGAAAGALFGGLFDGPSKKPEVPKPAEPAPKPEEEAKPVKAEEKVRNDFYGKGDVESEKIRKDATKTVEASYGKDGNTKALPYKESEPIGDLSKMSPEERLKVISKITQNDPNDPKSAHYCGPSALIAAAMYGGGNEGVNKLITQMKNDAKDNPEEQKRFQAMLEKSQGGGLDLKDIHGLEKDLHADLQKRKLAYLLGGIGSNAENAEKLRADTIASVEKDGGCDNKSIQNFINQSGLNKDFFDKDGKQIMNLNLVANNSKNTMDAPGVDKALKKKVNAAEHWVLDINDASGGELVQAQDGNGYNTVYDPWNRGGKGAASGQVSNMKDNAKLTSAYFDTSGSALVDVDRPATSTQ